VFISFAGLEEGERDFSGWSLYPTGMRRRNRGYKSRPFEDVYAWQIISWLLA